VKVSSERIEGAQVVMTIEIEPERLDQARERALRKLAPRAKVPGFRPGKAPANLIRQYFGEERILDEALDELVPQAYVEAVKADESIEPIAQPRLVVETTDPLVVKATIPVRPTVELGEYRSVRVTPEPIVVDESRVDDVLQEIRRSQATFEPVETPIKWRDRVRLEVEAWVEVEGAAPTLVDPSGKPLVASKQREPLVQKQEADLQLVEERDVLFPGFEEQLLGHKRGDTFEFELPVPDDIGSEKLAGKQAHFTVTVLETKEEVLPAEDDEFAKQVGDGFESLEALKQRIRDDIRESEERGQRARLEDEIVSKLAAEASVEYPSVMLEAEVDRMMHDQAGYMESREQMERFLAAIGRTEEQLRDDMRPIADERLRRSLVVARVAEVEEIAVSDEEIDEELGRLIASAGDQASRVRQLFSRPEGRSTIRRNVLTRKTLDRLLEIAGGAAAAQAEPEAEPPVGANATVPAGAEEQAPTKEGTPT
jgi:trigger factor